MSPATVAKDLRFVPRLSGPLNNDGTAAALDVTVRPGQTVMLDVAGSTDPDRDRSTTWSPHGAVESLSSKRPRRPG